MRTTHLLTAAFAAISFSIVLSAQDEIFDKWDNSMVGRWVPWNEASASPTWDDSGKVMKIDLSKGAFEYIFKEPVSLKNFSELVISCNSSEPSRKFSLILNVAMPDASALFQYSFTLGEQKTQSAPLAKFAITKETGKASKNINDYELKSIIFYPTGKNKDFNISLSSITLKTISK